jgi:hypothetical protein
MTDAIVSGARPLFGYKKDFLGAQNCSSVPLFMLCEQDVYNILMVMLVVLAALMTERMISIGYGLYKWRYGCRCQGGYYCSQLQKLTKYSREE